MADDTNHLADEILAAFADHPESVRDRAAVERHLSGCTVCRAAVTELRVIAEAMREDETWWLAGEIAEGAGPRALREFVERRELEDAEAERLLRPVLASPYRFGYANVARRKRYHTGGVVRLLCKTAWSECPRSPRFARTLAETACVIAEALPDDYYPAAAVNELRGTAWKEYSTACRYLAEYDAAYDALARAERAYRRLPDFEVQLAVVALCRAGVMWEQERYTEALPLARGAAQTFTAQGDVKRYFDAKEWEALILHGMGDVASARETYQIVYEMAESYNDAEMQARSAKNLGIAYRDAGDTSSASNWLSMALQMFAGLDMDAMAEGTRWSIARLSLHTGNAAEAARRLPSIVTAFERLGMMSNAAHARLDLAEALLLLNRPDEVLAVCADLRQFFHRAKNLTGAQTAAAYLRSAAAAQTITTAKIEYVRTYLIALDRALDLPFDPPPTI